MSRESSRHALTKALGLAYAQLALIRRCSCAAEWLFQQAPEDRDHVAATGRLKDEGLLRVNGVRAYEPRIGSAHWAASKAAS